MRWTTRERTVKRALLDAADLERATHLLDVGCGTGTFAIAAKRRYPHLDVVGVDPDPSILRRARTKADRAHVDVTFIEGSAMSLPLPDETFDRVTSSLVFHHLTSDEKRCAIGQIIRVLATGGEFHLADWVRSTSPLLRTLFWSVRLLDGVETTREHANGGLIELLRSSGLVDAVQHQAVDTPLGTIGLISARPASPGCAAAGTVEV